MSTKHEYSHLTIDADGIARITNTRYKVIHLAVEHYQHGWTAEELLRQHPDLRPEQVYSVLAYFYDHYDSLVSQMKATFATVEAARLSQPMSRDELLRRKNALGK